MAYWLQDHGLPVPKQFLGHRKNDKTPEEMVVEFEKTVAAQETQEIAIAAVPELKVPRCILTVEEAYIVAELIDTCLADAIRNDNLNGMAALKTVVYAYDKLSKYSGYKGMTE